MSTRRSSTSPSGSHRGAESPATLDEERRELDRYFAGKLDHFDLPIDWQLSHGFHRRAAKAWSRSPTARPAPTPSSPVAPATSARPRRRLGLRPQPDSLVVPCHRVLRTDGSLGGYGGGLPMKEGLLELEGARDRRA